MVKFEIKANPSGQYYFPKEVQEELGAKLVLICNTKAAIIFSHDTNLEFVLKSIDIIRCELQHRNEVNKNWGK